METLLLGSVLLLLAVVLRLYRNKHQVEQARRKHKKLPR